MKRLFILFAALLCAWGCPRAMAQDDQYVQLYSLVQEADTLAANNQPAQALAKYTEARDGLQRLQRTYPDWNPKVVSFRLSYLGSRIGELAAAAPPAAPVAAGLPSHPAIPAAAAAGAATATAADSQVAALQEQVRQLQADKVMLEAKLKEAFAARPASQDPRELTRAEDRIRTLEKENSLLKVSIDRQKSTPDSADTATTDQLKRELADANRKLAQQTERAEAALREQSALQTKLESAVQSAATAAAVLAAQKALDAANQKLADQSDLATKLSLQIESLQSRVKTLESDAETMAALHAENEILRKQLAAAKIAPAADSTDVNRQLAEAQARIAALQSDKEILRLEKVALQNRINAPQAPAAPAIPAAIPVVDSVRVRQLEKEKADLQKQLDAAQKQAYGKNARKTASQIADMNNQLDILRARLAVFEAQQVPLDSEELALLKESTAPLKPADPRAGQKSVRELPPGSAALVAEARRDFAAHDYEKAEEKYMQVLRKDEQNAYTLANLATIQLEMGRLDEAEKHIQRAVAAAPDDAYSLLVLGEIKYRRDQYDDALTALSRAAKMDPKNAEIQNYIGLALSQKGSRGAAETAFRKAIQLDPSNAGAHHNLAVFYITQRPPWTALARWHYQKALAAGFPPNAELEKLIAQAGAAATASAPASTAVTNAVQ